MRRIKEGEGTGNSGWANNNDNDNKNRRLHHYHQFSSREVLYPEPKGKEGGRGKKDKEAKPSSSA